MIKQKAVSARVQGVMFSEDVAEFLGISVNTVHQARWRKSSGCPLRKKGKRLIALEDEFLGWFKGGNSK